MASNRRFTGSKGFSLIEVLVAVVVLSVGLLALSALQVGLVRVSGETKAQSAALALAQEQLEDLRDFQNSTGYLAVTDGSNTPGTIGGVTYSRTWEIDRYVYRTDLARFNSLGDGNESISNSAVVTLNAGYNTNMEFKSIEVTVGWTDPTGAARSVVLSDLVSSSTASDSLAATEEAAGGDRGPRTRLTDPADQEGVIPIAVGDDEDGNDQSVAATDPKPQTFGTSGKVATRFTVQTYAEDDDGFLLQKNYDTAVVSCRCTRAAALSTSVTYAPSYWDGEDFTSPKTVTGKTYGTKSSGVAQDDLCTTCCRDHHDKTGQTVLFDPFRPSSDYTSGNHNHYLRSGSRAASTFTLAASANSQYDEACRLVRVDGVYQVTTDPQLENVLVLNTTGDVSTPVLDSTTKTNYATFAKAYITSIWTAVNGGTAQGSLTDYTPSPDGMGQTDPVAIVKPTTGAWPEKQMSSRAIFFDYLSTEAKAKLACVGQTSNTTCLAEYPSYIGKTVHQLFPFLTINLTGLGEWASTDTTKMSIQNAAIPLDPTDTYIRGRVQGVAAGSATASVSSYRGPAGLTDQEPISYHDKGTAADNSTLDARVFMGDTRGYTMSGAAAATNNRFVVELLNPGSDVNLKVGQLTLSSAEYSCSRGAGTAGTDPTDSSALSTAEHLCAGPDSTTNISLSLTGYNFITVTCPNGGYTPVDQYDPNTLCKKNNGTTATATNITEYKYKVCSIAPTTAVGQFTVGVGTPARTVSNHPHTEATPMTISANSNSALNLIRFQVRLYPVGTTCP